MKFTLIFLFFCVVLTACTLKNTKYNESMHSPLKSKIKSKHSLCTYNEKKGISALLKVNLEYYTFVFYPGDEQFQIEKSKLENQLSIKAINSLKVNDEIKTVKKSLIRGHDECPKVEIELISTPSILPH